MHYNRLGQSDIQVSVLALGCWPFGGLSVWGAQDDAVSHATVHAALDAGINFFDTAEGYDAGRSEQVLGQALVGRRHQAVIATKVSPPHLTAQELPAACARSLRNLGTEYVDLYQVHWPNWDVPLTETVAALERLREEGKIRSYGVCNFGTQDLGEVLTLGTCQSNQLPYSLLWRVIEREIRPLCLAEQVGIICYSPLAQGALTGRFETADDVPEGLARTRLYSGKRPRSEHDEDGCEAEMFAALGQIRRIAADVGQSMAAVALAWVRQQAGVTSLLVGARSPQEIALNLPALELTLSADTLQALSAATEPVKVKLGSNPDMWRSPSRMR